MEGFSASILRFLTDLTERPKSISLAMGVVLLGLVSLADYGTGLAFSLAPFYLFPIMLLAWAVSLSWSLFIAVAACLAWLVAQLIIADSIQLASLLWNAGMQFAYFALFAYLVYLARQLVERVNAFSRKDQLTQTLNRYAFQELAERELDRIRRYPHSLSFAYIDVDGLRRVNDALGYEVGDELLFAVGDILQGTLRKTDVVARVAGDEFAILMLETNTDAAKEAMTKIHTALLAGMETEDWPASFSIGVVTYLKAPETFNEFMSSAETLMHKVKKSGKNRVAHQVMGANFEETIIS